MFFYQKCTVGLLSAWFATSIAWGATPAKESEGGKRKKITHTYPMPPRPKPDDPMRAYPGYQIPEHPERYVWKVSGKIHGKEIYPQAVPLYNMAGGRPGRSGEIPVGTEVKLDLVMKIGRMLYYGVPAENAAPGKPNMNWISGRFIEATAYNPPVDQ